MTDKECRSQREALLPCPFCGGEAEQRMTGFHGGHSFVPVCKDCGAMTNGHVSWNTRRQAGAAWQQSRLLDAELVEKVAMAIMNADEEMWGTSSGAIKDYRHSAQAAIAEIKKHMEGV